MFKKKKISRFPSRVCEAVYNFENNPLALFRSANLHFSFVASFDSGQVKMGNLFLRMGPVMSWLRDTKLSSTYLSHCSRSSLWIFLTVVTNSLGMMSFV